MDGTTWRDDFTAIDGDTIIAGIVSKSTLGNVGKGIMAKLNAGTFDQPIVFAISITFVVLGMMAFLGWFFASVHWTGPLGLVKGGVVQS